MVHPGHEWEVGNAHAVEIIAYTQFFKINTQNENFLQILIFLTCAQTSVLEKIK